MDHLYQNRIEGQHLYANHLSNTASHAALQNFSYAGKNVEAWSLLMQTVQEKAGQKGVIKVLHNP